MKDGGLIEQNERKTGGGGQDMNNVELFFFLFQKMLFMTNMCTFERKNQLYFENIRSEGGRFLLWSID